MFYHSKSAAKKAGAATVAAQNYQFAQLVQARNAAVESFTGANMMTTLVAQMNSTEARTMGVNAVGSVSDLYTIFDQQVMAAFTQPDEMTVLNDLSTLSRSVSLTDMVYKYARNGGQGPSQTSMSGQQGMLLDNPDFDFDGTLIPIHDNGFSLPFRSPLNSGTQSLMTIADTQAGKVMDLKRQISKGYFEGWKDKAGNYIQHEGQVWKGFRNDSRVDQVTLTVDLTDAANLDIKTAKAQFITLRDRAMITNRLPVPATYYISQEMSSAFEQRISDNYAAPSFLAELSTLRGVAAIKVDASLTGNEILIIPLAGNLVAPINGSAIATVATPRNQWNSDYTWQTWGASGLMVKSDYFGCKTIIMATSESGS